MPSQKQVKLTECDFAVIAPAADIDPLEYYQRLREYIQHEDGLINSRLTWSLTVHGFLFGAFGIVAGKIGDVWIEIYRYIDGQAGIALPLVFNVVLTGLLVFEIIIACIGAFVGSSSAKATRAAAAAIEHLNAIAHSSGLLQIPSSGQIQQGSVLLPRIMRGGAHEEHGRGAADYYSKLPQVLKVAWWTLAGISFLLLLFTWLAPNWIFAGRN